MPASVRAQAGQALIALAAIARDAWKDPQFIRRTRHGDPTAMAELRARACAAAGVNAAAVAALLRQDGSLSRLWDQTIEQARTAAPEGGSRLRGVLILAASALALCVVAWLVFNHYQGEAAAKRASAQPGQPVK